MVTTWSLRCGILVALMFCQVVSAVEEDTMEEDSDPVNEIHTPRHSHLTKTIPKAAKVPEPEQRSGDVVLDSPRQPPPPTSYSLPPTLYVGQDPREVEDTTVECLKTHMLVRIKFTAPFNGYIYPHNNFARCLLFSGHNSREAEIILKHGTCGDQENKIVFHGKSFIDPIIEHRLVVQWDREFIGEDDSSLIVRCDRPDDYNKTVAWNFMLNDMSHVSRLERGQHPGPKMWMEIQKGEGPRAPPLNGESVYVGETLTLVFTLTDDVYWFDSNIYSCYAVDGGEQIQSIEWERNNLDTAAVARVFSGESKVIENGCSIRPQLFSDFYKERRNSPNGDMITLHYAHFKAFRFPTSLKMIIQCDVQVCYKECEELPPCKEGFIPRSSERRKRRAVENQNKSEDAHPLDEVKMYRSIEVLMPDEGEAGEQVKIQSPVLLPQANCISSDYFYGTTIALVVVVFLMLVLLIIMYIKFRMTARVRFDKGARS